LIKTTAATAYGGGSCANLQAGTTLAALNGARPNMNDFVVYATQITIQPTTAPPPTVPAPPVATPPVVTPTPTPTPPVTPVPPPFETTVTVSSLVSTSACPYREFMVGGYRLTTSALTRYDGGHCADIAAGRTLAIVATRGNSTPPCSLPR
jgi:hypothetical protein